MAKNLTTLNHKLDRITERLGGLDTKQMTEARRAAATARLMQQSLNVMSQSLSAITAIQHEISLLTLEALKASRESSERAAEMLATVRKQ